MRIQSQKIRESASMIQSRHHKPRGKKGHRAHRQRTNEEEREESSGRGRPRPSSTFRRAFRDNNKDENDNPDEDRRKHDEKLRAEVADALVPYSRQRMRALHMSLRQYANDAARISIKDVNQSFQENQMNVPTRTLQLLIEKFDDPKGLDVEGCYRFMTDAHSKTGRDSVLAMHKRNDLIPKLDVTQDEIDEDLIWRVESLLVKSQTYIDIPELRTALQTKDTSKTGRIEAAAVLQICTDKQMPVFGALLKNLIKRCDEEKNEKISWPEFISFLERAQQNAWVSCPELKTLPDKMKQLAPVQPSPIDELSSRTRNALVNKLRKKASIKKPDKGKAITTDTVTSNAKETTTTTADLKENTNATAASDNTSVTDPNMVNVGELLEQSIPENTTVSMEQPLVQVQMKVNEDKRDIENGTDQNVIIEETTQLTAENNNITLNIIPPESTDESEGTENNWSTTKKTTASNDTTKEKEKVAKSKESSQNSNKEVSSNKKKHVSSKRTDSSPNRKDHVRKAAKKDPSTSKKDDDGKSRKKDSSPSRKDDASKLGKKESSSSKKDDVGLAEKNVTSSSKTSGESRDHGEESPSSTTTNSADKIDTMEELPAMEMETNLIKTVNLTKETPPKVRRTKQQLTVTVNGTEVSLAVPPGLRAHQTIDPPNERMKLLWVYGYRGNDCRKNIHTLASGGIVYFMSYMAVIYNREAHRQKHYKEHTDEIKWFHSSMDVHSNGITVATGQYANRKNDSIKAHIRIWRSDILQTLHVCGMGQFEKSVACVAFAPGKDLLAAVDNSLEKRLTIWNTSTGKQHGEEILNTDLICDIGFNKRDPEVLVTVGKEHVCWWKIYPDSNTIQSAAKPEYEGFLRAKFTICLTFTERGDLITGDSNGTIYVWGDCGNRVTNYIKHAHDGPVFTVLCYHGYILSGGRDGIIHCFLIAKNMDDAGFIQVPRRDGGIRMLQVSETSLLIGTTMNSMLTMTLSQNEAPLNETAIDYPPLTQCHYDELRGLTIVADPEAEGDVITAGLDGIICSYNSRECMTVSKFQVKGSQFLCVDADSTGTLLALGTKDGHLQILSLSDDVWTEIVNQKLCKDRLDTVKFSPDGTYIAAGGHDSCIYVYGLILKEDETRAWEYVGKMKAHAGPINGLDWSREKISGEYQLRSSSDALDYRLWTPATLESLSNLDTIADVDWASHSCVVNVHTVGILASKHRQETEIESLDVNPAESLVAMGDNSGSLNLFRFPATSSGVFCHAYKSHACVHSVRFTGSGSHVMTVGGRDSCLMQWELV